MLAANSTSVPSAHVCGSSQLRQLSTPRCASDPTYSCDTGLSVNSSSSAVYAAPSTSAVSRRRTMPTLSPTRP